MITLNNLRKSAMQEFPQSPLGLVHILITWGAKDPEGELSAYLQGSGIDSSVFVNVLKPFLTKPDPRDKDILVDCIQVVSGQEVLGAHILKTLCQRPQHRLTHALTEAGMNREKVLGNIHLEDKKETCLSGLGIKVDAEAAPLLCFGRDLTALAMEGAFDELCERPEETNRLMNILLRKRKGNPVLTGPAGVGKTALVELFAREAVSNGQHPLSRHRIFEISMGKLVAGTKYRGEFEARFEAVMKAAKDAAPVILFIDELHLLLGAGRAEGAAMDGANLIKPYIARDDFRVIGATTGAEYQRYIVRDEALARRFQEIKLKEPDPETLLKMARQQARALEKHHKVTISDRALGYAIELTNKHLLNRNQPDKTIDLLDSAAVAVRRNGGDAMEAQGYLMKNRY